MEVLLYLKFYFKFGGAVLVKGEGRGGDTGRLSLTLKNYGNRQLFNVYFLIDVSHVFAHSNKKIAPAAAI